MKKLGFIALLLVAVVFVSCKKDKTSNDENVSNIDKSQIVGKWMTADKMYYEVYNSDGTGKFWDLNDDVTEDEAQTFKWEFDNGANNKFIQYHNMEINGAVVPQYCNILELTSTTFKYNNEGFRKTYNLIRAN